MSFECKGYSKYKYKKPVVIMTAEGYSGYRNAFEAYLNTNGIRFEAVRCMVAAFRERCKKVRAEEITLDMFLEAMKQLEVKPLPRPRYYITGPRCIPPGCTEADVIAWFVGTGVDVVDSAGTLWRNGKVVNDW